MTEHGMMDLEKELEGIFKSPTMLIDGVKTVDNDEPVEEPGDSGEPAAPSPDEPPAPTRSSPGVPGMDLVSKLIAAL